MINDSHILGFCTGLWLNILMFQEHTNSIFKVTELSLSGCKCGGRECVGYVGLLASSIFQTCGRPEAGQTMFKNTSQVL